MIGLRSLFQQSKTAIIGMVHIQPLPGCVMKSKPMKDVIDTVLAEVEIYRKNKLDGVMLENMHDRPWLGAHQLGPETTAAMAVIANSVRTHYPDLPLGLQILSGANKQALAVAKAAGFNWIRAEAFVFSHIGDEGPIHSCAAELLRYRNAIEAQDVMVFTDIKKKHSSHSITSDISLVETAQAAELFLSDGVIVSGTSTGSATNPNHVKEVKHGVDIPVLVGSGVTVENVDEYMSADALIVGSHFKENGDWQRGVDPSRVKSFMNRVFNLRDG